MSITLLCFPSLPTIFHSYALCANWRINSREAITVSHASFIPHQIVKELLVREGGASSSVSGEAWCPEEQLPEETRCKLEGLKCMARWLLGLKKDELSAQKTFRMLNAFIVHKGDLLQVIIIIPIL